MDDVDARLADAEEELKRLRAQIEALGNRFTAGERSVRPELNAAIRREGELRRMHHEWLVASGRYVPQPPVMYGPPAVPRGSLSKPRRGLIARLFGRE